MTNSQKKNKVAEFIKHAVDIEAYGNSLVQEMKEKFRDLYDKIVSELKKYPYISSKEKYNVVSNQIEDYIDEYGREFNDWMDEQIDAIVDTEQTWLIDYMAAAGITYTVAKNIAEKVRFMPIAEVKSYLSVGDQLSLKMSENVGTTLKTAYIMKQSTEDVAQRVEDRYARFEKYLDNEVTTFNTAIFRNTDYQIFKNNNQKVRYSAVLDHRTCLSCGEYHGMIFNITEAPAIPLHYGCRCCLIPTDLFSDEDISTFSDWIEDLSDDEKREYLGKGRYEMYKAGVPVTSFVDNGRILTLDELRSKSN